MSKLETLTGKKLKQKLKELNEEVPPVPPKEMARRCGYYTITEDNEVHVDMAGFYIAVLNIKNISD